MRALRVVGLDEDGETVICEDPENGDRFSLAADERLRAAARGDLTRLGQAQIEMEAQMRPREIQTRIRNGASVEQIALASGLPEQRVERYAHPVLQERAQIAERAQRAHPVREDGPDVQTLGEVVAQTFGMRGHDYAETNWDAWKGDDGKWVVQMRWHAGRSENAAHWAFHPGMQGGTVAAVDDHAAELLDPSPNRPLRTVRPVTALAREALELDHSGSESGTVPAPQEAPQTRPQTAPRTQAPSMAPPQREDVRPAKPARAASSGGIPPLELDGRSAAASPVASGASPAADEHDSEPAADDQQAEGPEERKAEARRGRNHPIVPSWEDVLLGVRSHR